MSCRTGRPLTSPLQSAVRAHSNKCGGVGSVVLDNFQVVGTRECQVDLRILESLHIYKDKPNLNNSDSAFPLKILR